MDPLSILQDLIATPSVNPMGRDVAGPEFLETRVTDYLLDFFGRLGVECETHEVLPGRKNVVAGFRAPHSRRTFLLDAHQDTVPVDGMSIAPFQPLRQNGRIYGRGACDVKGSLAAMLAAFARLVEEEPPAAANVVLSCTCDEEAGATGIADLVRLWNERPARSSLLKSPPELGVVAEPTDLNVVVAHRGATRWKIRTHGQACHSSRPEEGINAIYRMAHVLSCLQQYAGRLPASVSPHPLCGPPTLSVGRIEGGSSVNTVPDSCTIEVDRRLIPGEDGRQVIDDVADFLRKNLDFECEMLPPWLLGLPLPDDQNTSWAEALLSHIKPVAGRHEAVGVTYGTHASRINAAGVPAVVFGPGSIHQAHTADEWIRIEEVQQACEIYYRFCATGGEPQTTAKS